MSAGSPLVGRLAPSPTGFLHLGHARSFLLAWWSVRSRGGRIVLRMEDLDSDRARNAHRNRALRDLAWLGLDWDGEIFVQSAETTPFEAAVERLLDQGRAYACTCSRRQIRDALDAPHAGGELRYPGTCRGRWASPEEAERATGRAAGIRFSVSPGTVSWHDRFLGDLANDVASEVGDFLIARRDGAWAYQLAVVVDDARQGVTEVLRGDDLAGSAARQKLLQQALALPHPVWVHVPLVVDERGRRLAKRDGDLGLAHLRKAGVDPRAVVAWAARSAGLSVPQRVSAIEVARCFDLGRVPRQPVAIDQGERGAFLR